MREKLIEMLNQNEDHIIRKLIDFAKAGGFTRYTSTRHEDWVLSVREIILGLSSYLCHYPDDVVSVEDLSDNPVSQFGIKSARLHRARGITIKMFLGLFKYYRRAYLDMVNESTFSPDEKRIAKKLMNTYFDRFELGFCSEWAGEGSESRIQELQEVNRDLTNEKNKLRTIFESMTECVFVVDSDMRITEINGAAAAYFGVSPEDVIGMACSGLLGCDCKRENCQLYIAMSNAGCYKNVEVEISTKRGRRRILTSGSFLHDISGKYAGGVQVFVDVTERYTMEQALRLHMQANDSSIECVTIFDEGAQLIYANPEATKLLGKDVKDLMGLGIEEVYPEGERILFTLIRGDYWRGVLKQVDNDPFKEQFIDVHASPIRRSRGQIIGFHVAAKDITEHKITQLKLQQAREEIEREAAKLRAIVSVMSACIALADAEGTITEVNEQCSVMIGRKREEIIGQSLSDIHRGETLEKVWGIVKRCSEEPHHPPVSITRTLGERDVIMNIQPVYRDNKYDGILLMVIDVTEVAESKRQAEQARETAERANQAKSEFLANMSHEIRTPMNGIVGFAEVLLQQGLNSEQQESVSIIQQCGEQLMELINDILDLSKIESGKLVLEETVFSLRKMIYETVNLVEPILMEKGVEIKISLEQELPDYFSGDPTRIRQVLNNLLSNAAKFTHEGFVGVSVTGEPPGKEADTSQRMTFTVSDTGIGIPSEKEAPIFEAFTQADGSTTRKYGGTGLGLTISRRLTELMGGQIQVHSELNKGSTFSFTIPVSIAEVERGLTSVDEPDSSVMTGVVLVIEDDWTTKQLITNYLEKAGYTVIATDQGKQALTLAKVYQPDAIILDILLPDLNGWDILIKIKKIEETQQIPVIVCSVLPEKERAFSLGAVDFVEKPVSEKILVDCLRKLTLSHEREETLNILTRDGVRREPVSANMQRGSVNVLLVEDNQFNQKLIEHLLTGDGYQLTVVGNGQEALEVLDQQKFDIVLMDMQMPVMDGYEATRRIRNIEEFKKLPVIALTAHAMKGDCEKCLSVGCNDYLAKPVKKDMLIKAIKQFTISPGEDAKGKRLRYREKGIESLVPWYLQDLAGEIDKLKQSAKMNDLVTVRYIGHGLKGSGGAYGFPELSNIGGEIERAAVNQNSELVRELVNQLRELYTDILEEEL